MNKELNMNKIYSIIIFQRKVKFILNEIKQFNTQTDFLIDLLMNLLNNLSKTNNMKIFSNTNSTYAKILTFLKNIKENLVKIPSPLKIHNLFSKKMSEWQYEIYKLSKQFNQVFYYIGPNNISYIFKHFYGKEWINYFNNEELEQILFYSRMFVPICVWNSEHHIKPVKLPDDELTDTDTNDDENISKFANSLLENLIGKNKDTKIIVEPMNKNSSIPQSFIKSISELVSGKNSSNNNNFVRNNKFSLLNIKKRMGINNIYVSSNKFSTSLLEEKRGACLYFKIKNEYIVIQGYFRDDLLDMSHNINFIKKKFIQLQKKLNYEVILIPKTFRDKFLKTIGLRDIIINNSSYLIDEIRRKFNDFKNLQGKPLIVLINEFMLASKYRKIDIITLLLLSNDDNRKLAYILFDLLKQKDIILTEDVYNSLHHTIRDMLNQSKIKLKESENKLKKLTESDISYSKRISLLKSDDDVKTKAMTKLKSIKSSFQGDSKAQSWLDGLLKIPFNIYKDSPVITFKSKFLEKLKNLDKKCNINSTYEIDNYINTIRLNEPTNKLVTEWDKYQVNRKLYIKDVRNSLDKAVYGHTEAKLQIERIIAQWINGEMKGAVLGLEGPPGTGKTSLAKQGISKCLKDADGEARPFAFLPIGGSTNGSTLVGHNYTYVGSTWGRIVDILMTTKCMNPIIFIDEVDKISNTDHGREISSILTHLTDLTQNDEFEDKYFSGIKFDLSKALIVFSFNHVDLIDPILRDRITIIKTNPLTTQEKVTIVKRYMLPEILNDIGFTCQEIIFTDEIIQFIIVTYTLEAGVRKLKEKIYEIVRDINLKIINEDDNTSLPFTVTKEMIKVLFENKPKVRVKKIPAKSSVGLVNGLYATKMGMGGITVIQVMKYPADKMLELNMTGKQGDVMKESIQYALKIAFSILPKERREKILEDAANKKTFGLHIHTPEAAVPKDGPSAGAAMTLAMYSVLMDIPVRNDIALTGEIDLCKNVTAIGGVEYKLNGAKRAGVKLALIPQENKEDFDILVRKGLSPVDDNFEVKFVETIDQVLENCLVK